MSTAARTDLGSSRLGNCTTRRFPVGKLPLGKKNLGMYPNIAHGTNYAVQSSRYAVHNTRTQYIHNTKFTEQVHSTSAQKSTQ